MDLSLVIHCATPAFGRTPVATARELRTLFNRMTNEQLAECIAVSKDENRPVQMRLKDRHNKLCGIVEITP